MSSRLDIKFLAGSCSERQTACCQQTQHNTAAVSLSDGWAWYRCNPIKAFWRITMSNSKPWNMHCNNKGISQTFFNLCERWTGDWHNSRSLPRSPPLLLLPLHPQTISPLFFPLRLSITLHVTPFDVYAPVHHPLTFFHSISLLQSLFSSQALFFLRTPPSSVCLCKDRILRLVFNVIMMQLQRRAFLQTKLASIGSFHSLFLLQTCMTCLVGEKDQVCFTGCCKMAIQGLCVNFCRKKEGKRKPMQEARKT